MPLTFSIYLVCVVGGTYKVNGTENAMCDHGRSTCIKTSMYGRRWQKWGMQNVKWWRMAEELKSGRRETEERDAGTRWAKKNKRKWSNNVIRARNNVSIVWNGNKQLKQRRARERDGDRGGRKWECVHVRRCVGWERKKNESFLILINSNLFNGFSRDRKWFQSLSLLSRSRHSILILRWWWIYFALSFCCFLVFFFYFILFIIKSKSNQRAAAQRAHCNNSPENATNEWDEWWWTSGRRKRSREKGKKTRFKQQQQFLHVNVHIIIEDLAQQIIAAVFVILLKILFYMTCS